MCENCITEGNGEENFSYRGKTILVAQNLEELLRFPEGLRIKDMWTEVNQDVQQTTLRLLVESDEPFEMDGVKITEKTAEFAYPLSFNGSILRSFKEAESNGK